MSKLQMKTKATKKRRDRVYSATLRSRKPARSLYKGYAAANTDKLGPFLTLIKIGLSSIFEQHALINIEVFRVSKCDGLNFRKMFIYIIKKITHYYESCKLLLLAADYDDILQC